MTITQRNYNMELKPTIHSAGPPAIYLVNVKPACIGFDYKRWQLHYISDFFERLYEAQQRAMIDAIKYGTGYTYTHKWPTE